MIESRKVVLLLALALMACGSTTPPPAASPTTSAAPSGPTSAAQGRCLATMVKKRPSSGWVEAGQVILTLQAGQVTRVEVRDAKGRVVESGPLAKESDLLIKPCTVNGYLAVAEGELAMDGTATMTVLRPIAESESGDVAFLCKKPAELNADGFLWRSATNLLEERLTSRRWRSWVFELDEQLIPHTAATDQAKRTKADELDAAAKAAGIASCWAVGSSSPLTIDSCHRLASAAELSGRYKHEGSVTSENTVDLPPTKGERRKRRARALRRQRAKV